MKNFVCVCFVKLVVKFALDLDVIKTKNVSLSKKLCLVVSITSVNTTSNDLLRVQADVENFR